MTAISAVGTTLKISASLPATNDRVGYAALPFTLVGEVTDLEMPVREYELKTHYPLTQRGAMKRKGNFNDGRMVVTLAVDDHDAGQILASQARDSDAFYSFKVSMPVRGAHFFQAQVMSFSTIVGSANDIVTGVVVLEVDSRVGVLSVADESLVWAFDAETLSLTPTEGTGTPTFTRAGATATRVNSSGLIEVVAADTSRFDYDPVTKAIRGLLIEEARTNLALYSSTLSAAAGWFAGGAFGNHNPATRTANAAVAPDGTLTASRITGNPSPASGWTQRFAVNPSTTYAFSIWAYVESGSWALAAYAGNAGVLVETCFATTIAAGGFVRYSGTYTVPPAGVNQIEMELQNNTSSGQLIAWGAQCEVGAFSTSIIPTDAASVTRNADVPSALLSAIAGFNNSALTLYAEVAPAFDLAAHIMQLHNGGANRIIMERAVGGSVRGTTTGATGGSATASGTLTPGGVGRIALAVQANDMAISLNGGAVGTDATLDVPAVATLRIGSDESNVAYWNGHIRKLRLYNRRLSNDELVSLSGTGELPT